MITSTQITIITSKVMGFYKSKDWFHGPHHLRRTMLLAQTLMQTIPCNREIVVAGVILHQLHDGAKARIILQEAKVSKSDADAVVHCVECCHPEHINQVKTIEAKIVYDADKVQCCGWRGKLREFLCNAFVRNLSFKDSFAGAQKVERDSFSHLQTAEGRRYGKKLWRF